MEELISQQAVKIIIVIALLVLNFYIIKSIKGDHETIINIYLRIAAKVINTLIFISILPYTFYSGSLKVEQLSQFQAFGGMALSLLFLLTITYFMATIIILISQMRKGVSNMKFFYIPFSTLMNINFSLMILKISVVQ